MEILERSLNRRDALLVSVTKQRDEALLKLGDMIQEVGAQTLKRADAQRERDQWRECAKELVSYVQGHSRSNDDDAWMWEQNVIAEFERLKGETK
jgi:hypothetical protein